MSVMDYESFKKEIFNMTTIDLGSYKEKQMKRRIDSLIKKNNINDYQDYVKALKIDHKLYNEFINYLTINVTEFYRNPGQWEVLEKEIIPFLMRSTKSLKIWSSACSTGDEPYTLAMLLNKMTSLTNIRIIATDIDKEAMEKAKRGIYSQNSIENLPVDLLNKHFTKEGNSYLIKEDIKRCVEFKQLNLLRDPYPADCDLIICRNVLIYFTEEAKNGIYKEFNRALRKNGILFVGSTEQIIAANKYNFKPVRTFFYLKEGDTPENI